MSSPLWRVVRGSLLALALSAAAASPALATPQALDMPQQTTTAPADTTTAPPAAVMTPDAATQSSAPASDAAAPSQPPAATVSLTPAQPPADTTAASAPETVAVPPVETPTSTPATAPPPAQPQQDQIMSAGTVADYQLGPGDQLRITVFGESDLTGLYQVGSQGTIAYPLVGEVQATGLTIPEFTDRLRAALMTYIRAPNVSVEVANYRPFFILGEVQRPGTYPYSANLTVQNAVATAGGFTYRANRGRVYIRHANESVEHALRLDSSTPVMPGDTVRIGERFF